MGGGHRNRGARSGAASQQLWRPTAHATETKRQRAASTMGDCGQYSSSYVVILCRLCVCSVAIQRYLCGSEDAHLIGAAASRCLLGMLRMHRPRPGDRGHSLARCRPLSGRCGPPRPPHVLVDPLARLRGLLEPRSIPAPAADHRLGVATTIGPRRWRPAGGRSEHQDPLTVVATPRRHRQSGATGRVSGRWSLGVRRGRPGGGGVKSSTCGQ